MKRSKFYLKTSRSANGVDVSFRKPGAGEHLHHIVPAADPSAADVRELLMNLGIHPNSVFNGVGINSDVHQFIHNQRYYDALRVQLRRIDSTEHGIAFLDAVARYTDQLPTPNNRDHIRELAEQITNFINNYQ